MGRSKNLRIKPGVVTEIRDRERMSREEFAERLELSTGTVERMERGSASEFSCARLKKEFRIEREWLFKGLPPSERSAKERDILAKFAPTFPDHPCGETVLAEFGNYDFESWDPKQAVDAVTYGEVSHLWSHPRKWLIYEAHQLRFQRAGGKVRRIFLLGHDLAIDSTRDQLMQVILRHKANGFATRVMSFHVFHNVVRRELDVAAHMLVVFRDEAVFYMHYNDDYSNAHVVKTSAEPYLCDTQRMFDEQLWPNALDVEPAFAHLRIRQTARLRANVENQARLVAGMADLFDPEFRITPKSILATKHKR